MFGQLILKGSLVPLSVLQVAAWFVAFLSLYSVRFLFVMFSSVWAHKWGRIGAHVLAFISELGYLYTAIPVVQINHWKCTWPGFFLWHLWINYNPSFFFFLLFNLFQYVGRIKLRCCCAQTVEAIPSLESRIWLISVFFFLFFFLMYRWEDDIVGLLDSITLSVDIFVCI